MENYFGLLIFAVIVFVHIYGFWLVYKRPLEELGEFSVLYRGVTAGITASFVFALSYDLIFQSWLTVFHFYLMLHEAVIGIIFTLLFWAVNKKLELNVGVIGRALFGGIMGVPIGIAFGMFVEYHRPSPDGSSSFAIVFMLSLFALIAAASGVMAGEMKSNEYRRIKKRNR